MDVTPKSKTFFKIISALAVVGILDSLWLLYVQLSSGFTGCEISSTVNCSVLQMHTYSEWFDIPIPLFSALFYVLVLLVSLSGMKAGKPENTVRPILYLFFFSLLSLGATLHKAYTAYTLRTLCPFCFVLYVVSLIFCGFAWKAVSNLGQPWGYLIRYDLKQAHRSKWVLGTVSVGILTLLIGHEVFKDTATISNQHFEITSVEKRTMGDPSAAVTVTTFSDFECPHCKIVGEIFHQLESEMKGKVKIVYKFFPLDRSCNPTGGMHKFSCLAARAAYCSSMSDKFWMYHDLVYADQETLKDSSFYEFARVLNLDLTKFDECLKDPRSLEPIQQDIMEGSNLGITGTPAIFINGKRYQGPPTLSALKDAVSQM